MKDRLTRFALGVVALAELTTCASSPTIATPMRLATAERPKPTPTRILTVKEMLDKFCRQTDAKVANIPLRLKVGEQRQIDSNRRVSVGFDGSITAGPEVYFINGVMYFQQSDGTVIAMYIPPGQGSGSKDIIFSEQCDNVPQID